MISKALFIIDWLLWCLMAISVFYVLFFSLVSLLPKRKHSRKNSSTELPSYLILFPAYKEDAVIVSSVQAFLRQDYPKDKYHVAVISDHIQPATNEQLASLPLTLLLPSFDKSSKAKALQYAVEQMPNEYDYVVILDADNVVEASFSDQLSKECEKGYQAIQCHRTAKNAGNDIAVLDGLSEEINNTIFRKGHNRIGLSSALIGSGMCFSYQWFRENVFSLNSAVEDRELEALLLKQGIYIHYAEDIYVKDEKVDDADNFQRQRLRWMTGQLQSFVNMLPYIPKAIITGNINYIDKTIQQALIPRSMLVVLTFILSLLITAFSWYRSIKWWMLFIAVILALFISVPKRLYQRSTFTKVFTLPKLAWKMLTNILIIDRNNTDFIHTTHNK